MGTDESAHGGELSPYTVDALQDEAASLGLFVVAKQHFCSIKGSTGADLEVQLKVTKDHIGSYKIMVA